MLWKVERENKAKFHTFLFVMKQNLFLFFMQNKIKFYITLCTEIFLHWFFFSLNEKLLSLIPLGKKECMHWKQESLSPDSTLGETKIVKEKSQFWCNSCERERSVQVWPLITDSREEPGIKHWLVDGSENIPES